MRYAIVLMTFYVGMGNSNSSLLAQNISCPLPTKPHKSTRFPGVNNGESRLGEYAARAIQAKGNFRDATTLVAEYLDSRPALLSASAGQTVDPTADILSTLKDLRGLGLGQADWKRAEMLEQLPAVEGSLQDANHTTVYLRGQQQHAVKVFRDGRVELLDTQAAALEYRDFCRRDIRQHSTADMALFDVERVPSGGREVYIAGKAYSITPAEYADLKRGNGLPKIHPLASALHLPTGKAKVLYSNPKMQKQGAAMRDADEFAFALQRSYPEIPIYRDPLSNKTNELVKHLNDFSVTGPRDVVAVVADDSFRPKPKDYNLIQDLKGELTSAGVRVVSYKPGAQLASASYAGKGLIVITGHSSAELAGFVHALGAQGAFKNSYVLFNSCETPLSRQLIAEINTRYGAAATFAHEGKIQVNDLDPFLSTFAKRLSTDGAKSFHELIMRSLHEHNLNGVWTICSRIIPGLLQERVRVG